MSQQPYWQQLYVYQEMSEVRVGRLLCGQHKLLIPSRGECAQVSQARRHLRLIISSGSPQAACANQAGVLDKMDVPRPICLLNATVLSPDDRRPELPKWIIAPVLVLTHIISACYKIRTVFFQIEINK